MNNKKAQEEMVGFVLIMLVVAVIFLVFLSIFIRKGSSQETGSAEIDQFLSSSLQYTTGCRQFNPYTIRELITECSRGPNEPCDSSQDAPKKCDVLRSELKSMAETSWNFGPDSPDKGYLIQAVRENQNGTEIVGNISIAGFGSTSTVRTAEKPLRDGVILYMEIYS